MSHRIYNYPAEPRRGTALSHGRNEDCTRKDQSLPYILKSFKIFSYLIVAEIKALIRPLDSKCTCGKVDDCSVAEAAIWHAKACPSPAAHHLPVPCQWQPLPNSPQFPHSLPGQGSHWPTVNMLAISLRQATAIKC